MGGENGCGDEKNVTSSSVTNADGMDRFSIIQDLLPGSDVGNSIPLNQQNADKVVIEDEVEDGVVDNLGSVESMDGVLEPDSIVFRDRNFVGYPREPSNVETKPSGDYVVVGSIKFGLPFDDSWQSTYGTPLLKGLASSAGVPSDTVAITSLKSGVIATFRITPTPQRLDSANSLAQKLNVSFHRGEFMAQLVSNSFPQCNFTVVEAPKAVEVMLPVDISLGYASSYKQYTTQTYIVSERETVTSIASKFQITPALLVSFNEDVADPSMLQAGDVLFIPTPQMMKISTVSTLESPLEGGAEIVIKGSGFVYPAHCKFGDIITRATHVVEDTLVCVTPEQREPGLYALSVSDGKGGFQDSSLLFHYTVGMIPFCDEPGARPAWCRPRLAILSVVPLRIPQDTDTTVVVTGTGFNASTICTFDGVVASTTVLSRTKVECTFASHGPGVVRVTVNQGSVAAATQYDIVVFSTLTVSSIEPNNGPEMGGVVVKAVGTTFKSGCMCRFNDMLVPAKIVDSSHLECVAPASEAKIVNFDVSNDGKFFSPDVIHFEYTFLKVDNISETEGPVEGGNIVTLYGYGFYPGSWCKFGTIKVLAEYQSLSELRCRVPAQEESKSVHVSVSLDGVRSWTEGDIVYDYVAVINELRPFEGRVYGGEEIQVLGTGFSKFCGYICQFGANVIPAVVVSTTQVTCVSPPGIVGPVDFVLESKSRRYTRNVKNQKLTFTYVPLGSVDVFGVFPAFTDVRNDATVVTVTGSGFVAGTICRFGDKSAMSTYVNDHEINCVAPMRELAEIVPVTVSHDGGRTWSGVLSYFEYRGVVQSLSPPLGYVEGGNDILVTGYGFNYRMMLCVFGNRVVPANVNSQYSATCTVPVSEGPAKVPFAMTCNKTTMYDPYLEFQFKRPQADQWGSWYVYSLNPHFIAESVSPKVGSTTGGYDVTVSGEGFDETAQCLFGNIAVKAVFLDAATVRCVAPSHVPGDVEFRVQVFNQTTGYNVSVLAAPFTFHAPTLTKVEPSSGSIKGGMSVHVTGEFLNGASSCYFGTRKATIKSSTDNVVECELPAGEVSETVAVTLDYGISGSSVGEVLFVYEAVVDAIEPTGAYVLTSNQMLTFRGAGFNGEPLQCQFDQDTFVPATVVSKFEVKCSIPFIHAPRVGNVNLVNQNKVSVGKVFNLVYNPVVQDIHPSSGATTGGSSVVVLGSGFSSVEECAFGDKHVKATVISDIMVRCTAPASQTGVVQVKLVSSTFSSSSAAFTFKVMNTRVLSIYPTAGSPTGGSLVSIHGEGFTMDGFCKFGTQEVPVNFISPTFVQCFSPPRNDDSDSVTVEVSQLGNGDGYSFDGLIFSYHPDVSTVVSVEPAWAEAGDTIEVIGTGFIENSTCFFGGRKTDSATYVGPSLLRCTVPKVAGKSEEIVQVATETSALPGGHVVFHYLRSSEAEQSISVSEIKPAAGSSVGGTVLTVTGLNFPDNAQCRFGDLYVPAVVESSKQLTCTSPQHNPATVVLEIVSPDHSKFSSSMQKFTFNPTAAQIAGNNGVNPGLPGLESVRPEIGKAGDTITLSGRNFSSVGFCVFEDETGISTKSTATAQDSSAHVSCSVPEKLSGMSTNVSVKYLSIDGVVSQSVLFTYAS